MARKAFVLVEGHGEIEAIQNLITRLWSDLGLSLDVTWGKPKRGTNLNSRVGILKACELLRSEKECAFALLVRDADDACPAHLGPQIASWVEDVRLPFPASIVLAHREYEAWFLPCLSQMAGRELRPGLRLQPNVRFKGDPEDPRGVKEWLTQYLYPYGKAYKPTLDQLALTRLVDFELLRRAKVPSFGTLENALRFLNSPGNDHVYPPPMRATRLPEPKPNKLPRSR